MPPRKRKRGADTGNTSDAGPELTDGVASATPSPMKRRKTPDEKDAEWLEIHEYSNLNDEEILGV